MMRIDVLTLFPGIFSGFLDEGIIRRARLADALAVHLLNLREFCTGNHRPADDYPFGGGAGMLMKPEPVADALNYLDSILQADRQVIYLSPAGMPLTQATVRLLSGCDNLVLLCGHYEGIDQRIIDRYVDMELSVGDYILSGGEPAAMILIDAVARLLPGVLGSEESILWESFEDGLLEYPQYTRPAEFEGESVPEVLLSGNHGAISRWRRKESLRRTLKQRPDLVIKADLSASDRLLLQEVLME